MNYELNSSDWKKENLSMSALSIKHNTKTLEWHLNNILENLPSDKKQTLSNTRTRNNILTSEETLRPSYQIFEEGFYFIMEGCRCSFKVFIDYEGNVKRLPKNRTLIKEKLFTSLHI